MHSPTTGPSLKDFAIDAPSRIGFTSTVRGTAQSGLTNRPPRGGVAATRGPRWLPLLRSRRFDEAQFGAAIATVARLVARSASGAVFGAQDQVLIGYAAGAQVGAHRLGARGRQARMAALVVVGRPDDLQRDRCRLHEPREDVEVGERHRA